MTIDTSITVDYIPVDAADAEHLASALQHLADAFELPSPDITVWTTPTGLDGRVALAYRHPRQLPGINCLARIISHLLPGRDVRVEEEGSHGERWGQSATYRSGNHIRSGIKDWIEQHVTC
jgi:hypothetical protein